MIDPSRVVVILLAAGLSRRFGEADKLLADYRGRPLVAHAADLAASVPFRAVVAVCRPDGEVGALLRGRGFGLVTNPRPEHGMGSSLGLGVGAAEPFEPDACLILLGDMPEVTPAHLLALLAAFDAGHDTVTSIANGRRMPPTLFGRRHFPQLRALTGDQGARQLTQDCRAIEAAPLLLRDIDMPADLTAGVRR